MDAFNKQIFNYSGLLSFTDDGRRGSLHWYFSEHMASLFTGCSSQGLLLPLAPEEPYFGLVNFFIEIISLKRFP